ncbi:TPA: ribosome biogenesis protein [Candidatus Bathyarchaeota archaeon]|nr:ribosome biogenesis protein [Candidatus Bathyarchaeota archaeon]
MKWLLRKCGRCGEYTILNATCPRCGGSTKVPHPAPLTLDDRYLRYKLEMRRASLPNHSSKKRDQLRGS